MMKVLAVAALKGGVSKTTLAVHLSAHFAESRRVSLVDRDAQQSSLFWGEKLEHPQLTVNGDLKRPLHEVLQEAADADNELAIVDCAPGIGGAFQELHKFADLVLIPTQASALDLRSLSISYHELREKNEVLPCYAILTQVSDRHVATREVIQAIAGAGIPMLGGRLHRLKGYSNAAVTGTVFDHPEIEQIAQEISNLMSLVK